MLDGKAVHSLMHSEPPPRLGASLREVGPGPGDDDSWKKIHALALRQLNRFMSCEAKVLKGKDPEAIHDMRVASRRLQQLLDLIYPKPRPQGLRRLRRQIRRCRGVLGEVRNCDVLLERVEQTLGRKRLARREAWTAVQQYLLVRRSEGYTRALRKLGKINPAVLYVNLKELLTRDKSQAHPDGHHHHAAQPERPAFSGSLTHSLESVWKAFEEQVSLSHSDARPAVIHAARIATKRLRYLLEVLHEFKVAGSSEALAWLRELQQHLGDWHDLQVLEQMMIEMLARPEFLQEHLGLAIETAKLVLNIRKTRSEFEARYIQMSRESAEIRRLKEWVPYLTESPSATLAKISAAG